MKDSRWGATDRQKALVYTSLPVICAYVQSESLNQWVLPCWIYVCI